MIDLYKRYAKGGALFLLFSLGFAGNYFKLSLFYGFDFLFGSIFLMVLLNLFGVAWGVFATVLASSCTYLFWHHPYGIIVFSLEVLFVGIVNRKRDKNIVLLDGIFWLCIGSPLNWLLYYGIMKASFHMVLFVVLKQSVNGIFNALIASVILDYFPIQKWIGSSEIRKKVSIQQAMFNLILAVILVPVLLIMVMNSRKTFLDIEGDITNKLRNTAIEARHLVNQFIQRHMEGVGALSDAAAGTGPVTSKDLQDKVRTIKGLFPYFHNMYVANAMGVTVAFYPERNEKGNSTIGLDFSDRAYYRELKRSLRPVMSDVFQGRGGVFLPIVTLSAPILEKGQFKGFALGALDLNRFKDEVGRLTEAWGVKAMVLDGKDKVVASTNEAFLPLQTMDLREKGEIIPLHPDIYQWLPPVNTAKSAFGRWTNSFYILETPVGNGVPWKVLLSVPVAPYQRQLYESTYIYTFSFMLVIIVGSMFFSAFLSRRLVHPIEKLMDVTTNLPSKLALREKIDWPESILLEVHSLVGNFKLMTSSLVEKFVELKTANESLEQRVAARTRELSESNDELCSEIRERKMIAQQLFEAQEHLEAKIRQRTGDLVTANEALQEEIAKHRHTEECLASEKELLSITLLSIGDGVISTDTGGRVVLMNKVSEELTGWAQRDAAGRPLPEIFKTFDAENSRKELYPLREASAPATGHVVIDDVSLLSRGGTGHIVSGSYAPIRDRQGDVIGGVLVFRDNTERKRIEERLLNAQKLESIGVLAGGIAHDFNNLLSAILGNISMAKAKRDHSSMERLEEIEKASVRAIGLTQQLLTFSKGGAPVRKTTSISEMIRQTAVFVTRGSNVRCEFRIVPDLRPVFADEGQLSQVVHNLVINAMQAMKNGGVIRISAENVRGESARKEAGVAEDMVKVSVRDEGPGIPAEILSRIFDPYFTTKEQGSGLGLATVYSIVKRHDGQIDVESRPGAGTAFHVYLPVSDRPAENAGVSAAGPHNGKGKILVMDDEEFILDLAEEMLGFLGYGTTCARNGAEAIDLYKRSIDAGKPYDAVIMDLTIPGGMGGKEALGLLKEIDPGIVAIVSSGYSNDPVMADPGRFGFWGVVTKPYTLHLLSDVMRRAVHAARHNAARTH